MLLVSTAHDDDPTPVRSADVDENRATNKLRARDRRRRRVALVVDDSEDAQEICGEALQAEGFLVQTAPDGRDALDLLIDIPAPAIIILDILMPNMNGLELLDIIRSYRRLAETPVLLITAGDEFPPFPDRHTLFMQKPVDTAALKAGVRQLLASTNPA